MRDFRQHRFLLGNKNSKETSFTLEELQLKRRKGQIDDTTPVWSTKLQAWLPYNEILSEEMLLGADLSYSKPHSAKDMPRVKKSNLFPVRPWIRFWARMIDYNCLGLINGIFFSHYFRYASLIFFPFFTFALIPLLWVPIEAILLSTIGTTPGKWILKVKISNKNRKRKYLTFEQACKRSIAVWFFGMGCGIPIIQIIALILAKIRLSHTKTTIWDKKNRLIVRHDKVGILRICIVILFFFIIFFILMLQIIRIFAMWEGEPTWR